MRARKKVRFFDRIQVIALTPYLASTKNEQSAKPVKCVCGMKPIRNELPTTCELLRQFNAAPQTIPEAVQVSLSD